MRHRKLLGPHEPAEAGVQREGAIGPGLRGGGFSPLQCLAPPSSLITCLCLSTRLLPPLSCAGPPQPSPQPLPSRRFPGGWIGGHLGGRAPIRGADGGA